MIYQFVKAATIHPTAEMIYQALKEVSPGLSRGTVYRNLSQLTEEGLIVKMPFSIERYDGVVQPHPHLVCSSCGAVMDLPMEYDADLDEKMSQAGRCQITRHDVLFYGRCQSCAI